MKKLMSLMFLGFAAFAGGGLLNEHNLTTFVNYLYHKQQVGTVINLGTIADTPPAELPSSLPTFPGAVPQANTPLHSDTANGEGLPQAGANRLPSPNTAIGHAQDVPSVPDSQPASNRSGSMAMTPVPGTPPPPLSIKWPNESSTTYGASLVPPSKTDTRASGAVPHESMESDSTPPIATPNSTLGSSIPNVPPPMMESGAVPADIVRRDENVMPAASSSPSTQKTIAPDLIWSDLENKMRFLGVTRYECSGSPGNKIKFRCELANSGSGIPVFEAEAGSPHAAAQMALKRIVIYNAARRAARFSSDIDSNGHSQQKRDQNGAAQLVGDSSPSTSPEPPSFDLPAPTSEGPPPPPADIPN